MENITEQYTYTDDITVPLRQSQSISLFQVLAIFYSAQRIHKILGYSNKILF